MNRYHVIEPGMAYAATCYGDSKRDALSRYRAQWYPNRNRLPRGVAIWAA